MNTIQFLLSCIFVNVYCKINKKGMLVTRNLELKESVAGIVDETIKTIHTLTDSGDSGGSHDPDHILKEVQQSMVILAEAHFDDVLRQLFEHKHPVKPLKKTPAHTYTHTNISALFFLS